MEDFNFPDICWKCNTVQKKQSRTLLECIKGNLLIKLVRETTRGGVLLDLLFTNKDWWEMWWSEAVLGIASTKC